MNGNNKMWFKSFAASWNDGLPIGNGRLAAMIWGEEEDIISLNHEKLWTGITKDRDNYPVDPEARRQIGELIEKDDMFRATALANTWFGGLGGQAGIKGRIDSFQPAGDIRVRIFDKTSIISRELDMENGLYKARRKAKTGEVLSEAFIDASGGAVACRWTAESPVDIELSYSRTFDSNIVESMSVSEDGINYKGEFIGGISFGVGVGFNTDGVLTVKDNTVYIKNAKTLLILAEISVKIEEADTIETKIPQNFDFDKTLEKHIKIFSQKMNGFYFNIDAPESGLPVEERWHKFKAGEEDTGLLMLAYNFGRYLLFSSNICAEYPANLQGKWNRDIKPPWNSDYHFDINVQMNYWPAEPTNAPETAEVLLALLDKYVPHSKKAAKDLYGCRGIWMPIAGDMWGRSTPESHGWAVWTGSAAWMALHYYDHYLYNGDIEFLRNRCYPFLKEVALFYEDYLKKDSDGVYQFIPSQSPENEFEGIGHYPVGICKSSAMDIELAFMVFGMAIEAAEILGVDKEQVEIWKERRANLPEFKIGKDGRLLEWEKERKETEPGHRHQSHLIGLYPGEIFTEEAREKELAAAKKSLDFRVKNGCADHGAWIAPWVSCLYARLGEGENLLKHIGTAIRFFCPDNLLDICPLDTTGLKAGVFQIETNFGIVAAMTEAVAQSRNNRLYLLYALPKAWQKGEVKGLKARGGHTLDMKWEDGKPTYIKVKLGFAKKLTLVFKGKEKNIEGAFGEEVVVNF